VFSKAPQIARAANRIDRGLDWLIGRIGFAFTGPGLCVIEENINLGSLPTEYLDGAFFELDDRFQLDRKRLGVPLAELRQPVVGKAIGADLCLAPVMSDDHRDIVDPDAACGFGPGLACDNHVMFIDQDRHSEPELPDRSCEFDELSFGMFTRVVLVPF